MINFLLATEHGISFCISGPLLGISTNEIVPVSIQMHLYGKVAAPNQQVVRNFHSGIDSVADLKTAPISTSCSLAHLVYSLQVTLHLSHIVF